MPADAKRQLIRSNSGSEWKLPLRRAALPRVLFTFSLGLSFGFTLATLILSPYASQNGAKIFQASIFGRRSLVQETSVVGGANVSKTLKEAFEIKLDLNSTFVNELLKSSEEVAARRLAQEIRILCLVMTMTHSADTEAVHSRDTWGRHCNVIHFISTIQDPSLPTAPVHIKPGRDWEWAKAEAGFEFAQKFRMKDFEWVVKVSQDTFVVVENLRTMLSSYSHNDPIYFELSYGVNDTARGSNSAGYVLSKEAVDQLVTRGYNGTNNECRGDKNKDAELGKCLQALAIKRENTRDSKNRRRCLPFDGGDMRDLQNLTGNWWEEDYVYWPMNAGLNCCSNQPISFHGTKSSVKYMLEYLIYHVRPYSVMRRTKIKLPLDDVLVPGFQSAETTSTARTTTTAKATATVKNATTSAAKNSTAPTVAKISTKTPMNATNKAAVASNSTKLTSSTKPAAATVMNTAVNKIATSSAPAVKK